MDSRPVNELKRIPPQRIIDMQDTYFRLRHGGFSHEETRELMTAMRHPEYGPVE